MTVDNNKEEFKQSFLRPRSQSTQKYRKLHLIDTALKN